MPRKAARLLKYNVEQMLNGCPPRTNFNVAILDDAYAVRIAEVEGTFPEHHHTSDEGWYIQRGAIRIDSELGSIVLSAGEGTTVPAGVRHSPTAMEAGTLVVVVNRRDYETVTVNPKALADSGYSELDADLSQFGPAE